MLSPLLLAAAMLAAPSAAPPARGALDPANPFAKASTLPFQAPPFDRIKDSDYLPAIRAGMAEQRAEMDAIAADPAPPTFDNTIVAMERSGRLLERARATFTNVNSANTSPALQRVQATIAPELAAHQDATLLDPRLFARVRGLHDRAGTLGLTDEQAMLLRVVYARFVRAGALLRAPDQEALRAINRRLSVLGTAFGQKLLAATKAAALGVDGPARLAGLGQGEIAAAGAAAAARGQPGLVLPLQNTVQQPAQASLSDRATRRALFEASWTRAERGGDADTRATLAEIAELRARKAALLDYPTWADYQLADQMAGTPAAVRGFLAMLVPATAAAQARELGRLKALAAADGVTDFQPWDWQYYAERLRRRDYDLDEAAVKPYLEIDRVLRDGVFYAANRLYGLTFKERRDLPVYQPDVRVFEVDEEDGRPLGLMYFDYWKRDNKNGGAWMSNFVGQSALLGTKPVIYNVANFQKPAPGQPALISFDDVTTMFHEFGHALHGLFAAQTYPSLSGASATARDFVEFPSQFNEHWALDPAVLGHYARDYRTGAAMPAQLVEKIRRSRTFDQGYAFGELLAAQQLDLAWHALPASAPRQDADAFEAATLGKLALDTARVPPRYRSSIFQHIWSGGYAAGYYAYTWTDMLDEDAYGWFAEHGGLTRANGQRFRDLILSRGHARDYAAMFREFRGRDPDIAPLLAAHGLVPAAADGARP